MWKYIIFLPLVYTSWSDLHNAQSLEEFRSIVDDFRHNFPCEECREDFDELVQNHPFPVEEVKLRPEMRIWSWLTHNMVNKKIGKPWVRGNIMSSYPLNINLNDPVDSPGEWLDPEALNVPEEFREEVLSMRKARLVKLSSK